MDWYNLDPSYVVPKIPRPKDMTPLEERQYDKYCSNKEDPCAEIKAATNQAIEDAMAKLNNLLIDKNKFFQNKSPGWSNHISDLDGRLNKIYALISLGIKMGCNMSSEEAKASLLYLPLKPNGY